MSERRTEHDGLVRAFDAFVAAHTQALLRSAFLLAGDAATAEDLVQETFVRLYPKWAKVAAATVPIAYVRRALLNNFLNSKRSKASTEVLFGEFPDHRAEATPDPSGAFDERDLVLGLLAGLPPRSRAILVLRFYEDRTDDEIADLVGCRPGTVRSTVSRSLAVLRTRIEATASAGARAGTEGVA